jgi:hypothetical protein
VAPATDSLEDDSQLTSKLTSSTIQIHDGAPLIPNAAS